ncbi:MAG: hypothetical protein PSV35_05720 [bacterium]|nr:hypothetical protein [bacterium]
MSDFKSKLPDLKELGSMTSKLFNGIKQSVTEIVHDYKQKRAEEDAKQKTEEVVVVTPTEPKEPVDVSPVTPPIVVPIENIDGTPIKTEPVVDLIEKADATLQSDKTEKL